MTVKFIRSHAAAALALFAALALPTATKAGDDTGDIRTWNLRAATCQDLYNIRNGIYDRAGYCFKTDRALEQFSNRGCRYTNISSVPLSSLDEANVQILRRLERRKGCSI